MTQLNYEFSATLVLNWGDFAPGDIWKYLVTLLAVIFVWGATDISKKWSEMLLSMKHRGLNKQSWAQNVNMEVWAVIFSNIALVF